MNRIEFGDCRDTMRRWAADGENRLIKKDWEVRPVPLDQAQALVREYHYARGGSNTGTFVHGLYHRLTNLLVGVVWWIPPTKGAAATVNPDWKRVLNLTRMVMIPGVPKNACSFLLARSVKAIKRDGRFVTLLTYADQGEGHDGGVYRAANWQYVGESSAEERWIDPTTGRHVARKAGGKTRTAAEMESLGYIRGGKTRKHKFVLHLAPRKATALGSGITAAVALQQARIATAEQLRKTQMSFLEDAA